MAWLGVRGVVDSVLMRLSGKPVKYLSNELLQKENSFVLISGGDNIA